jgi:outer membrane protein
MMKVIFLAAVPAVLAAQQPSLEPARPISLQQAIRLAQENSPTAVQARGQVSSANSERRVAVAGFAPSLSWSMSQSQQNGERFGPQGTIVPYTAQPWSYNTGLSARLNLFDGGKRIAALRQSSADITAAQANQVAQDFNLALQVKTQYYNILAAEESEGAAMAQLQQAQEQLKVSTEKLQAGAATRSDSLRSAIQVGNAQLALLTARNNRRIASAALTRLAGTTYLVTADPSDTLDTRLTPVDSTMLAQLAMQGPAIRQAEAQVSSANMAERSAKTQYLPSIDLSYSRSGSGFDKYFGIGGGKLAYSNNLGLSLSFPLFNNWSREDAVLRAGISAENAEANLRDARLAQQQTLIQDLAALNTAQEQIRIQMQSVAAAEEDLRVQQQRYQAGASVLLDVLTSQTTLNQSRLALIQARLSYRTTKAQIEQLVGRDLN